jgi:glycerophosphoryl diester phosphodiesterase
MKLNIKNKTIYLILISISIFIISFFYFLFFNYPIPQDFNRPMNTIIISHGGYIDNLTYTNSYEALLENINKGYKFIEIDLLLSKDNILFGAHDLKQFHEITGFPESAEQINHNEIADRLIYLKYKPLFAENINKIFTENPSLYLVTDKITDFDAIKSQLNFPNIQERLLVEVFSYKQYVEALRNGIKYPMLCVGGAEGLKKIMNRINDGLVKMITFEVKTVTEAPDLVKLASEKGVIIFAYTENNIQNIIEYSKIGVTGFYSDTITPLMLNK